MKNSMIMFALVLVMAIGVEAQDITVVKIWNNVSVASNAVSYSDAVNLVPLKPLQQIVGLEWVLSNKANTPVMTYIQAEGMISGNAWITNSVIVPSSVGAVTNSGSSGRVFADVSHGMCSAIRFKCAVTNGDAYLTGYLLIK